METSRRSQVELSDLAAAALLLAHGCELEDVVPSESPGRQLFVISGPAERVSELLAAFDRGDARVALIPYLGAQRLLRDRLFRHQRVRVRDAGRSPDAA
jgi:hypothetical protein